MKTAEGGGVLRRANKTCSIVRPQCWHRKYLIHFPELVHSLPLALTPWARHSQSTPASSQTHLAAPWELFGFITAEKEPKSSVTQCPPPAPHQSNLLCHRILLTWYLPPNPCLWLLHLYGKEEGRAEGGVPGADWANWWHSSVTQLLEATRSRTDGIWGCTRVWEQWSYSQESWGKQNSICQKCWAVLTLQVARGALVMPIWQNSDANNALSTSSPLSPAMRNRQVKEQGKLLLQ